jgi:hypothetical protein
VGRNGKSFVLHGAVQTETEKRTVIALAALAAGVGTGQIDGLDLHVAPAFAPIAAKRVEHMLNKFVNHISTGWDPLRYARLSVSGGVAKSPLKVTGTVIDPRAPAEAAQLIKEVYPSANPVDVSGILLRKPLYRPVRRWRRRADAAPVPVLKTEVAAASDSAAIARPAGSPKLGAGGSGNLHVKIGLANSHSPSAKLSTMRPPELGGRGAKPGAKDSPAVSVKTYTVQAGDTIYGITHKYGRDISNWHELWNANRRSIHKPGSIASGTKLTLPAGWKAP